ncbi:MAG: hypothetical protein JXM73_09110 [Anaerolineae bacterium]|nr:hypothetical protein [Anaerolineae bacterium]
MLRITLHVTYDRRVLLLLASLGLALLLSASVPLLPSGGQALAGSMPDFVPARTGRHVYLTIGSYLPTNALTACASGYHMASLWEILDVSNLIYDYAHPSAATRADSGHGPPSAIAAWVRTGYSSFTSSVAGTGNCSNWTSPNAAHYGTVAYLSHQWETVSSQADLWDLSTASCDLVARVWCAKDAYMVYLPLIARN